MKGLPPAARDQGLRARRWDAIVLGGALPGLVAAARLAMDGQRVLVVEEDAAARAHPGLREPFFLAGSGGGGILDACLKALTIPLIDRKKIEPDPIAYQIVLPEARLDVGEPNTTAEELVAWGLAKPDEAQELVRGLLEAAHAERAAMLDASVVRAGGLRALARGAVTPRPALHGRGLPVGVSSLPAALLPFLDAQVRALSNLADGVPGPEARGRLLGSALEGGAGFAAASDGFLRGLLKRRIQALFGEFRTIGARFELVTVGNAPGLAVEGSHDVWVGRALVLNAPRSSLAATLAEMPGGSPTFLDAAAPTRRRVGVQLRVRRSVLPEGMSKRVIRVRDLAQPRDGTNVIWLTALPAPHGGDFVDVIASAIVPSPDEATRLAHEAEVEAAARELMPFSERDVTRERAPAPLWDEDLPGDPRPGEGWPLDVEIRVSSRPPIYLLPREAVAALGFEGDILLGWRAGDAIRADVGTA